MFWGLVLSGGCFGDWFLSGGCLGIDLGIQFRFLDSRIKYRLFELPLGGEG